MRKKESQLKSAESITTSTSLRRRLQEATGSAGEGSAGEGRFVALMLTPTNCVPKKQKQIQNSF